MRSRREPSQSRDELLTKLHIPSAFHANVGAFSEQQASYLGFHKDSLFLKAAS